jgi:hypothetical protein
MSRTSRLLSAVVLIASLVVALPAAAMGPAHRAPLHQASLWSVFWDWATSLTSLLSGASSPTGDLDRGALIDPNGSPR